ncbi:hypothetical protein SH661x_001992 [Planctomicrobium sp. SH661]|uniref:hypothetical protein n=1 Tax=Planctomicrobium sp. SH661 TaxID=3448124 RepID=UPI003F5CB499
MKRRILLAVVLSLWGIGLACGAYYINNYTNTPDPVGVAPPVWPSESTLPRKPDQATLVMFLHPGCPCSRASLWELEELKTQLPPDVGIDLVMVADPDHAEDWRQTPLQKQAAEIPDAQIVQDVGGLQSNLFHAATSGETFLYSATGELLFHGGITAARGHMGDAPGQDAILEVLKNPRHKTIGCSVFGCQLANHSTSSSESRP